MTFLHFPQSVAVCLFLVLLKTESLTILPAFYSVFVYMSTAICQPLAIKVASVEANIRCKAFQASNL